MIVHLCVGLRIDRRFVSPVVGFVRLGFLSTEDDVDGLLVVPLDT